MRKQQVQRWLHGRPERAGKGSKDNELRCIVQNMDNCGHDMSSYACDMLFVVFRSPIHRDHFTIACLSAMLAAVESFFVKTMCFIV